MLKNKFHFLKKNRTLLGVGPMSKNCVIAATKLSNKFSFPLMLIASRRQIDSVAMGGGYVNNWNTSQYSDYVKSIDKKKTIILCRDHGGPWQNSKELENKLNLKEAMKSAKNSFEDDIKNNFKIIHIDTSINPSDKKISISKSLDRFYDLFDHCNTFAKRNNKKIFFEVGTEEQSGSTNTPEELEYTLNEIKKFCKRNKFEMPLFVVIQAGTKVLETKNVGSFESPLRIENELAVEIQLPKMIEICKKYKIFMKEHNTDYLKNDSLSLHPKLGIHAANVAPEFGVTETKALTHLLIKFKQQNFLEEFLNISYKSNKWKKWLIPNSKINKFDKAIISGHYIFSDKKFIKLKERIQMFFNKKNINLDSYLQKEISKSIFRYAKNFNLIK